MRLAACVAAALALAVAGAATASERRPTLAELESELVCPTCETTLDQSNAPIAERMRAYILQRIAAGDSKSEIKRKLVARFGPRVVETAPPKEGFDLLAWLLPIAGIAAGATALAFAARHWTRAPDAAVAPSAPSPNGAHPVDPELERRVDEELARFDA